MRPAYGERRGRGIYSVNCSHDDRRTRWLDARGVHIGGPMAPPPRARVGVSWGICREECDRRVTDRSRASTFGDRDSCCAAGGAVTMASRRGCMPTGQPAVRPAREPIAHLRRRYQRRQLTLDRNQLPIAKQRREHEAVCS